MSDFHSNYFNRTNDKTIFDRLMEMYQRFDLLLQNELELSETYTHNTLKGNVFENILRKVISSFYGFTSVYGGQVFGIHNSISKEQDIIIFDDFYQWL